MEHQDTKTRREGAGEDGYALEVVRVERGPVRVMARARFGRGFVGFQGHFPGMPILPGFVQVQLALDALAAAGVGGTLQAAREAKFLRPVAPGEAVECAISEEDGGMAVVVTVGSEVASRMVLEIGRTEGPHATHG